MTERTLSEWLAHAEQLHDRAIDLGLDRMRPVAQRLALHWLVPVITVAGTNGKGSTCAMLEAVLRSAGYRTGVYTSPHLVHFNERCRIDGVPASDAVLAAAMARVEHAREGVALTYFEFTTLAVLQVFSALAAQGAMDAVVLEVGLGGRLDAVNLVDTDCAIITAIDLDHMALLGPDRESIAREKAGIMRAGRPCVCSDPVPPAAIAAHAQALGADLWLFGRDFNYNGDRLQWAWAGRSTRRSGLAYPALRGANQLLNASGVLAALEALRDRLPVSAQDVRNGFARVDLPGRFQVVPGQPALVLDVAHNPHSVAALAANLDAMGFFEQTVAVFGAMADKDIAAMLRKIKPLIDHWVLCTLPTPRAATPAALRDALTALGVAPQAITLDSDPAHALQGAAARCGAADRIVVFGS
ncbi:MAG: bifunctional tetrahydrofolate synthase/dihydrofolate synthase, partial [Betaproteobacteria bacterium]|nr:bifunctional tetrahydrofolate synthase/dihydrofolate synthase [Betaproteobacteria bacterium]